MDGSNDYKLVRYVLEALVEINERIGRVEAVLVQLQKEVRALERLGLESGRRCSRPAEIRATVLEKHYTPPLPREPPIPPPRPHSPSGKSGI